MAKSKILDYTTEVPASRTIGAIQGLLMEHGAQQILIDAEGGEVKAVCFRIITRVGDRGFRIPANTQKVFEVIRANRVNLRLDEDVKKKDWQKANMIAWRIALDWLEVTLALVKMGMVSIDESMMPYMLEGKDGQTHYELYVEHYKALPQGTIKPPVIVPVNMPIGG